MSLNTPVLKNLYLAHIPHSKYVFTDGSIAIFTGGRYVTDDPGKIAELDKEVRLGNPGIYVDPNARQIDPDMLDPMKVMRAKIIAEFLEEQRIAAATQDPNRNMGTSDTRSGLRVGSSQNIGAIAAGGNGAQTFKPAAIPAALLPGGVPSNLAAALSLEATGGAIPAPIPGMPNKEEVETQIAMQNIGSAFSDPAGQPVPGAGLGDLSNLKL